MRNQNTSPTSPRAGGGITRLAVARLRAGGHDPGPVLRKVGLALEEVDNPTARLDVGRQIALLDLAAELLNDDILGFHLAQASDFRKAGLLYFVLASSSTFREALERGTRYSTIANEGIAQRLLSGSEVGIAYKYVGVPRHADRQQIEFWATGLVRIARQMTGTSLRPTRAAFIHTRCAASQCLEDYFGCPIAFASERDEVAFASSAGELPLIAADPYLNDLLVGYCEKALAHRNRPVESLRVRVENAITPLLPHGKTRAGDVARALGIGQRTLARRLALEGLTFTRILDELRADLARHYLKDPSLSVSEAAWLLGFQEASAFTLACKRWTGRTPSQVRSQERRPPPCATSL